MTIPRHLHRHPLQATHRLLCIALAAALFLVGAAGQPAHAQDEAQNEEGDLYLLFDFMKVEHAQTQDYLDVERFWKRIHEQRLESGEIIGWDLWSLQPSGEEQGYQYLTVSLYDDPRKMMADLNAMDHATKAYPDLSQEELEERMARTTQSRSLAERYFLREIDGTDGSFTMDIGTVAFINFMKVDPAMYEDYESAEREIFKPSHQEQVDAERMLYWGFMRVLMPTGSDAYASHMTVDMYTGWDQIVAGGPQDEPSFSSDVLVERGLEMRDWKHRYMATLRDKVR